ncbi:hypothetical protein ABZ897_00505 [Nonomuraea sp. NPDC046802]|uniref:hypothetical protein n=1 Tax=Nonomuraea sp. NPDC046802 TaxID=3154919 RepID=UPI0033D86E55
MKRLLGVLLVAFPFVAMVVFLAISGGWLFPVVVLGGALLFVACILAGTYLLTSGDDDV